MLNLKKRITFKHSFIFLLIHYIYSLENMQQNIVTSKAWILMDAEKGTYLRGENTQRKLQIASLTKMYTLYACLTLNSKLKIDPKTTFVKIFDTGMTGTLANLSLNQYLSLKDLYYALMLPSGNDAASILATYYGNWLLSSTDQSKSFKTFRKQNIQNFKHTKLYNKKFIQYLNTYILKQLLNHKQTHFQNPHGLSDKNQLSTVWELAEAALVFMKNEDFQKIVGCPFYCGHYYESETQFQWVNTNILLRQGYTGIKTGITSTAGGCLASLTSIKKSKYEYNQILVVVLGCSSPQSRFEDTRTIVRDYKKYLQMMKL